MLADDVLAKLPFLIQCYYKSAQVWYEDIAMSQTFKVKNEHLTGMFTNFSIDYIFDHALQNYQGVTVGWEVSMLDLAYLRQ